MKKYIISLVMLLGVSSVVKAEGWKEVFKQTEGQIVDFAVASAIEPGYFRDLIGGRNLVGAQFPIVYVSPYLSADFGYVSGYEEKQRGSMMVGGTIRVNRLLEDYLQGRVTAVRKTIPAIDNVWDRLWFGPFIAHNFTEQELFGGIKAGLSF